jgi:hypothetical protein
VLATPALGEPTQQALDPPLQMPLPHGQMIVHAQFQADVQILGMTTYADGWKSLLAPVDLAVGWGPVKNRQALDDLRFKQGDRFYYWQIPQHSLETWDAKTVALHSTNVHIIPATAAIANQLLALRPGDQVTLTGHLVDVLNPEGLLWETSLTREDTGPGACEILYLSAITLSTPTATP